MQAKLCPSFAQAPNFLTSYSNAQHQQHVVSSSNQHTFSHHMVNLGCPWPALPGPSNLHQLLVGTQNDSSSAQPAETSAPGTNLLDELPPSWGGSMGGSGKTVATPIAASTTGATLGCSTPALADER
eukprot:11173635-Lingulodinium_polyedra.AAC.1